MAWNSGVCDPRRLGAVCRSWPRIGGVALALVLLFLPVSIRADQRDQRLDPLFSHLRTADAVEAPGLEAQIWAIWSSHPDPVVMSLLDEGIVLMSRRRWTAALDRFDQIVRLAPDFAEGWNKRATAHFLLGDLNRSVLDIRRTLALEPRHFGALAGLGQIYARLHEPQAALRAFEAALQLYPAMAFVQRQADELRARIQGRDI